MLVTELNQSELNAWGLGMNGCFDTVEDMLVLGVHRAVQSRPSLKNKLFLLTFEDTEVEPTFANFIKLTAAANRRITNGSRFKTIAYQKGLEKGMRKGILYIGAPALLIAGLSLPADEQLVIAELDFKVD